MSCFGCCHLVYNDDDDDDDDDNGREYGIKVVDVVVAIVSSIMTIGNNYLLCTVNLCLPIL